MKWDVICHDMMRCGYVFFCQRDGERREDGEEKENVKMLGAALFLEKEGPETR